jgi:predicted membrane protein
MNKKNNYSSNGNITFGLIILTIGVVMLLKALGFVFPIWFISWPMLLILIGVGLLAGNSKNNGSGIILILLGSFFMLRKYVFIPAEFRLYIVPVGLILLGLYLIFKKRKEDRWMKDFLNQQNIQHQKVSHEDDKADKSSFSRSETTTHSEMEAETFQAHAFFTGIVRRIFSKNFKGGKASAIFGGTEIDLTHADIQDEAIIHVEIAFGGVKMIVPSHWNVQFNMGTVIAAGVEDKRFYNHAGIESKKVLKINGSLIFGGLEVKSI